MQDETKMKKIILALTAFFFSTILFGQKQGNVWYFGDHAGLNFNTASPTPLLNGQTDFPHPPSQWNEGSSSICDSTGSLLFYSNGEKIWNRLQQIMPNGNNLMGNVSSTQSSIIVPQPGNSRYFYVFTTDAEENNFINGLRYSIVDMCLNNGNGDVISNSKNIPLVGTTTEKLICVRNSNGTDYWIVTHKFNSNAFYSFKLTSSGITDTVISHTATTDNNGVGQMTISPNGQMIGYATPSGVNGFSLLLNFNPATGIVSNERKLSTGTNEYGVSFSLDNSKLYFSTIGYGSIFQYNPNAGSLTAIIATKTYIIQNGPDSWRQMQLGPDGKIYLSRTGKRYLSAIELPNNLYPSCNYLDSAIYLGGKYTSFGLPNFIAGYSYSNTTFSCITSVQEYESAAFQIIIYPNPFSSITTIQTDKNLQDATLTVYNSFGQQVKQIKNISGQTFTFHKDNFSSGLYFFSLTQDNKNFKMGKLIITDN